MMSTAAARQGVQHTARVAALAAAAGSRPLYLTAFGNRPGPARAQDLRGKALA